MATSTEITNVQRMLNSVGESLVVDGVQGALTTTAIKKFQSSHDMMATGLIDSDLINALTNAMNSSVSSSDDGEGFFSKYKKQLIITASLGILGYGVYFINKLRKRA